jgi:hypothetical protein
VEKEPYTRAQQLLFRIAIFAGVDLGTRMIQAAVGENLQPGNADRIYFCIFSLAPSLQSAE